MELFSFDFQSRRLVVMLDLDLQLERLLLDDVVMSVKPWGDSKSIHTFEDQQLGSAQLIFAVNPVTKQIDYQFQVDSAEPVAASADLSEEAQAIIIVDPVDGEVQAAPKQGENSWIALGGIGLKLLKTVKVVKVALAAATVAVYSVMFTFEFALALVAVLAFHEYGHLRAMKKFGIPTKGMYLIPFFGGIAVGEKPRTQWESIYISMMGPVYGLLMTAVFYVIYLVTDNHFCGLVASTSALLNLFNLIPVHPLDGGHVVKALVFSRRNQLALVLLLSFSALCLVLSWSFGFAFLSFFIILGVVDIVSAWNVPLAQDIAPLKTYGIWYCLAWYIGVALAFLAMILLIADANVPGAEIAVKILKS